MLVVRFRGGLGNQMYQYAFCIKLSKLFPECIIKTDLQEYRAIKHHNGYEISTIFPNIISFENITWKELRILRGELPMMKYKLFVRFAEPLRKRVNQRFFPVKLERIIQEGQIEVTSLYENFAQFFKEKDYYFDGYWANINNYVDEMQILRENFVFKEFSDVRNSRLCDKLQEEESVSVHIRRGDYVGSNFEVLTLEYYRQALEAVRERVKDAKFYFFSDDSEFVQKMFGFVRDMEVVDWNRGKDSYKDMQLMSFCKHNIIANSTFSQWGALLNKNPNGIIIYPSKKDKNTNMEIVNLPNWFRIEV